jgi:hypothetical protein
MTDQALGHAAEAPALRRGARFLHGLDAFVRSVGGIIKSALTGPDGQSWAPGRLMAAGTFVVSQCLVIKATQAFLPLAKAAADWQGFFIGVGGFEAVTAATCVGLVLGQAPADPGGAWWKGGSPEKTSDAAPDKAGA